MMSLRSGSPDLGRIVGSPAFKVGPTTKNGGSVRDVHDGPTCSG